MKIGKNECFLASCPGYIYIILHHIKFSCLISFGDTPKTVDMYPVSDYMHTALIYIVILYPSVYYLFNNIYLKYIDQQGYALCIRVRSPMVCVVHSPTGIDSPTLWDRHTHVC